MRDRARSSCSRTRTRAWSRPFSKAKNADVASQRCGGESCSCSWPPASGSWRPWGGRVLRPAWSPCSSVRPDSGISPRTWCAEKSWNGIRAQPDPKGGMHMVLLSPSGARAGLLVAGLVLLSGMFSKAHAQEVPAAWKIPSNEDIRALLAERMQHNGVGMVVGVIEPDGQRVVAYGRSGARNHRALDGDTVFQLGSLSKPFVGLLLADMVGRGEVALDDPAQKYLPAGVK